MGNNKTDWIVLASIIVIGSVSGYIYWKNDINSEDNKGFEPLTKTVNSIFRRDSIGGSAKKHYKKKHGKGKTCKKH
jgi:hypothetical protein